MDATGQQVVIIANLEDVVGTVGSYAWVRAHHNKEEECYVSLEQFDGMLVCCLVGFLCRSNIPDLIIT